MNHRTLASSFGGQRCVFRSIIAVSLLIVHAALHA